MAKTWSEKYNSSTPHQVKKIDKAFADMPEGAVMLIATPQIIANYIDRIPFGNSISLKTMRQDLALAHEAEYTCPVTTGIFLRIVAEYTYEKFAAGQSIESITPIWRVISPKMPLLKKLSFDKTFIFNQRKLEEI